MIVSYFLDVLGSLWPDAKGLQPYSLFHYLDPTGVLNGAVAIADWLALLAPRRRRRGRLAVFPRRDLAAPS